MFLKCRKCERKVVSCPDPGCAYHHASASGMPRYPLNCDEDVAAVDVVSCDVDPPPVEEAKHTPGPWQIDNRHHVYAITCKPERKGEYPEICFVEMRGNDQCGSITARMRTDDELRANAQLIAAAPRLLAICEEIANDPRCDLIDSERRIRLYSAIDEAGGSL